MYILMINKAIKCSSFFVIFFGLFSKRNKKYIFFVFLWNYRNTRKSLGDLEKAFLVLPNCHPCFYNSIETRKMFSIS